MEKQIHNEKHGYPEILNTLLDGIKLLSSQNLALQGHVENLDAANLGTCNFLAVLQFLEKYDPVIACHLSHIRENPHSERDSASEIKKRLSSIVITTLLIWQDFI